MPVNASTPCLSLWERWLSEAKTERGQGCNTLSVTFGDSSPRGRAKGLYPGTRNGAYLYRYAPLTILRFFHLPRNSAQQQRFCKVHRLIADVLVGVLIP